MFIIDTHAHLNFSEYETDRSQLIKKIIGENIWFINVGCDYKSSLESINLAESYSNGVFASVGLHPHNVKQDFFVERYNSFFDKSKKIVAIGETGLDYQNLQEGTADIQLKEVQKKIFKQHIDLAILRNKPIILHCRRAHDDALEILEFYACNYPNQLKGVAHCFLGNFRQARRYRKIGFKIAFNGIITYSRDYDKVIIDTPLDDILLETDSPYLAPVPYRGLRNSPLYIIEVAKMIAKIKNVPLENVIAQTTLNAKNLFNL